VGTFCFLCGVPDRCSRYTVHREVRETMTAVGIGRITRRARGRRPWCRCRATRRE